MNLAGAFVIGFLAGFGIGCVFMLRVCTKVIQERLPRKLREAGYETKRRP